jgi:hypothetical protein
MLSRKLAHERTLAHRREPNEPNTRNTCPGHIEARTASTAAARRREQLALEFGKLGLELSKMIRRRLVLLGPSHLHRAVSIEVEGLL